MRVAALILASAGLAACTTAPEPTSRSAAQQAQYNSLMAGKTAGAPITCLPSFSGNDMRVIDDQTVIFRDGPSRLYVAQLDPGCTSLDAPGYAIVTKQVGQLCQGDIAQVIQTSTGILSGSCVVRGFTPYTSG